MLSWLPNIKKNKNLKKNLKNNKIFLIIKYEVIMSKKKKKGQFDHYKTFTLKDGTKFKALNKSDAELYRKKVGE